MPTNHRKSRRMSTGGKNNRSRDDMGWVDWEKGDPRITRIERIIWILGIWEGVGIDDGGNGV